MEKKVRIYSAPTCPYCHMVKEFLKQNKVEFEDIDVSENEDKAKEMVQKTGQQGVPVIEINSEIIIGFDKERLKKVLNLK